MGCVSIVKGAAATSCGDKEQLWLGNGVVLSAAGTWWGVKLTASRPRQSPLVMIAASERTLPGRFMRLNAPKTRSPIFVLFVSYEWPCRIGMFLSFSKNRK